MNATWNLRPGTDLIYDGDACTVVEIADGAIITRDPSGRHRRLRMIDVLRPVAEGGKARVPGRVRQEPETPLTVIWSDATDSAKAKTQETAEHVREVLTGYRSGSAEIAREGEPRFEYHPKRPLSERQQAKAVEVGVTTRTIERWIARYRDAGEAGLLDNRMARPGGALANYDRRWLGVAQTVLDEQTAESKVATKIIIERIRARTVRLHGEGEVKLSATVEKPAKTTGEI